MTLHLLLTKMKELKFQGTIFGITPTEYGTPTNL